SSLPSTVAAPTSNGTVLSRHNSACRHRSPQTQLLPTTDRQTLSYKRNMAEEGGRPRDTMIWYHGNRELWMTHRDLDIYLTTKLWDDGEDRQRMIYTLKNARRVLRYKYRQDRRPGNAALDEEFEDVLDDLFRLPTMRRYRSRFEHSRAVAPEGGEDLERQDNAIRDFENLLQGYVLAKLNPVLDIESLPAKAIGRLAVLQRTETPEPLCNEIMDILFRSNQGSPGYTLYAPLTDEIVELMGLYYNLYMSDEWTRWMNMAMNGAEFVAVYGEVLRELQARDRQRREAESSGR
ncbi:MAG: hypothetical protein LQ349_009390, partial [Xanthoria aureola]